MPKTKKKTGTRAGAKINAAIQSLLAKSPNMERRDLLAALQEQGFKPERALGRVNYYFYRANKANKDEAGNPTTVQGPKAAIVEKTLRTVRRILEADFMPPEERIQRAIAELPQDVV